MQCLDKSIHIGCDRDAETHICKINCAERLIRNDRTGYCSRPFFFSSVAICSTMPGAGLAG